MYNPDETSKFRKDDDRLLIMEVESHPVIYDKTLPEYRLMNRKRQTWHQIAAVLNRDVDDCVRRWKSLRDSFYVCIKSDKTRPSDDKKGGEKFAHIKWVHFKSLLFLLPFRNTPTLQGAPRTIKNEKTSHIPIPDEDSDDDEMVKQPSRSTQRNAAEPTKDVTAILSAISSVNVDSRTANQLFFASIACRTEKLPERIQAEIHLKVLQLVNDACLLASANFQEYIPTSDVVIEED